VGERIANRRPNPGFSFYIIGIVARETALHGGLIPRLGEVQSRLTVGLVTSELLPYSVTR